MGRPDDGVSIRSATPADLAALVAVAEPLQRRGDRHIAYLGVDAGTLSAEIPTAADDWTAVSSVAEVGDRIVGWLVGEVDPEIGRVWWWGPFVTEGPDWAGTATALADHAERLLPPRIDQAELAVDSRFVELSRWAVERGFTPDPASVILTLLVDGGDPGAGDPDGGDGDEAAAGLDGDGPSGLVVRAATEADGPAVAPLHDRLFPGTHLPGHRVVASADEHHPRLVAEIGPGRVVGYAAIEHSADGEIYIDFLGVDPRHRRRGAGRALVAAAVAEGRQAGLRRAALTVREDNPGARALYRSIGFSEERVLQPLRRGFRIL